ncbi:hypothetical protein L8106_25490 [Lyngbya sp. PCC 8106]|nr:hypothetical protein L8106_25490 [Lyngbya sp. PCC 8106]
MQELNNDFKNFIKKLVNIILKKEVWISIFLIGIFYFIFLLPNASKSYQYTINNHTVHCDEQIGFYNSCG